MEDHGARREGGLRVCAMLGVEGSGSWSDVTTPIDASLGRADAEYLAGQALGGGGGGEEAAVVVVVVLVCQQDVYSRREYRRLCSYV